MKQHRYRVTVEHLADADGQPSTHREPLCFEARNHDDLYRVLGLVRRRGDFDEATTQAFVVGLKLFGEVLLEHRDSPLFADFAAHFFAFMKHLKQGIPADTSAQK
ncbi:MAG: hypothetical protein GAK43_02418 [Stenotrophomonas maltophilia]|nr:MAG: hypothetical protein GAK43_02418 [Stenotrophomonas maltophilia]